jgi:hypothetical protein
VTLAASMDELGLSKAGRPSQAVPHKKTMRVGENYSCVLTKESPVSLLSVRCRTPGRSANPPLGRKVSFKEGKIKIYLTRAGILMEGHYTS